jgi:aminoglycoside phosphotransferase (APT) family kinase protein
MSRRAMRDGGPAAALPDLPVPEFGELDAGWWTTLLTASGTAPPGARVVAARPAALSSGRLALTARFELSWADERLRGPASLIGKFPADVPRSRETGQATDAYATEVAFYRRIAPTAPVTVPRCHFAASDPADGRFALILEDVRPAVAVDQVSGATPDQVAAALAELARLHAAYWACEDRASLSWVPARAAPRNARRLAASYRLLHGRFLERFAGRLSDRAVSAIERFDAVIRRWPSCVGPPHTLLHGDYRTENLLFGLDGTAAVTVLDWQSLGIGPGTSDAAYLIGGSLPEASRREHEAGLLRVYLDGLAAGGVRADEGEQRAAYRAGALAGLHMTVVSAMLVDSSPASEELFVVMAERHAAHADDLESTRALA